MHHFVDVGFMHAGKLNGFAMHLARLYADQPGNAADDLHVVLLQRDQRERLSGGYRAVLHRMRIRFGDVPSVGRFTYLHWITGSTPAKAEVDAMSAAAMLAAAMPTAIMIERVTGVRLVFITSPFFNVIQ